MNMLYRLLSVCVCLGFVFLYVQTLYMPVSNSSVEHNVADTNVQENKKTAAENAMDSLKQEHEGLDLMVDLFENTEGNTDAHNVYAELLAGYEARKMQGVTIDELLDDNEGRERTFVITTVDAETGEPMPAVAVYMRGALLGHTQTNGELTITKSLPTSHEIITFEAYRKGYSRGFSSYFGVHFEGVETAIEFKLNRSMASIATTNTKNFKVEDTNMKMELDEPCSLIDAKGDCYEGEVEVEYTFIAPNEARNTSVPMSAIHNGQVVNLMSNGMAFTDFFDENGEPLQYNKKNGKICYDVDQERIDMWKDKVNQPGGTNGYRWFNRAKGMWEMDQQAKITITDGTFCVETKYVY